MGYKKFLIGSVLLFAATSMGCAAAPNLEALLFFRGIQGLAGGSLVVWWRTSIYVIFPKAKRSPSLMQVSTILYLSSALGLLLSGLVTDSSTWRLIFLPDLVYTVAAVILLARFYPNVPRPETMRSRSSDPFGIGLLAVVLIALQVVLNRGEVDGWLDSALIRSLLMSAIVAFAAFVVWQLCPLNRTPLLLIALLCDRRVFSAVPIGLCTGIILSGSLFVLPEFLRNLSSQTHSAAQTGQLICVYAVTAAVLRYFVLRLVARFGQRKSIVLALVALVLSMGFFEHWMTSDTPDIYFILPLVLYGICLSPLLPSVGSGTVARIEDENLLDGVSIYMTVRQFGASLGVALLTILIAHRQTIHSSRLFETVAARAETLSWWLGQVSNRFVMREGDNSFSAHEASLRIFAESVDRQASILSYADAFVFMAAVGLVALLFVPLIPPAMPAPKK